MRRRALRANVRFCRDQGELPCVQEASWLAIAFQMAALMARTRALEPAPQDPLVVAVSADDDVVQAVHPALVAGTVLQPYRAADGLLEDPGPSVGPASSWVPSAEPAGPPGSVLNRAERSDHGARRALSDDDVCRSRSARLMRNQPAWQ